VTIDSEFLSLMPSTVTVYAQTARDAYGKQTFSPAGKTVRCRVVPTNDVVRDSNGREIVAGGRVYCFGTPSVSVDSRLVLPDESEPSIVSVQVQNDETGTHHTVITFGRL